jgi:hypothetical protein
MITNLEDCLEHLAGLHKSSVTFTIKKADYTIMNSIARQCFKGVALTDRQFDVMKEKLVAYKHQFIEAGIDDFENAITQTRLPLRTIDRSKYIKVQDDTIVIRFPFRKVDITSIQQISSTAEGYYHKKGTHLHEFAYNEVNVLNLLDRFSAKEYKIDDELLEIYAKIKTIQEAPHEYLSGIIDHHKLININSKLDLIIKNELGSLSNDTLSQFIDRRFRYGFNYVELTTSTTLAHKIASRKEVMYQSKPSLESIGEVINALWELNRFPLLVVLDKNNAEEQLYEFANYYRDILQPSDQSVLFRLEDPEAGFNQLVKDRKLNNWVDNNTKVVYISKDKLPKLLINCKWKPIATFSYNSRMDKFVDSFISFNCDLVIYREEDLSPFRKYSKLYD